MTASKDSEMFPRGYVAVLHDMVTSYHDKLAEFIPPAELEHFRASIAERIVKNLTWKGDEKWHEKVTELLADWGFAVKTESKSGLLECKIDCPYAHIVHPLYSTPTFCPISTLVAGAAYAANPKAKLSSIRLTDEGAEFMIES